MNFLKNLSLSLKIAIIVIIAVITFIITLSVNIYGINKTNANLELLNSNIYPLIKISNENSLQIQRIEELYSQAVTMGEEELVEKATLTYTTIKENINKSIQLDNNSVNLLNSISKDLDEYQALNLELTKIMMSDDIDYTVVEQKAHKKSIIYDQLTSNILAYKEQVDKDSVSIIDSSIALSEGAIFTALIIGIVLLIVMILNAVIVTRVIVKSAINTANSLADLANGEGNLSHQLQVQGSDELSQVAVNFNQFMTLLKSSITDIISVATPLNTISQEIEVKASNVNSSTQQLSSEAEAVKSSMLSMQESVSSISQTAINAANISLQAQAEVKKGLEVILDSTEISKELNNEVENASGVVNELAEDTQSVNIILDVIRSIAEQTNLLALNAAIEAARAGEQGRGFAVVADEVRTLASRTSDATDEISELVVKLADAAIKSVNSMEIASLKSDSNAERSISASESLSLIKEQVADITSMNTQISSEIKEQTVMTERVLDNSTVMNDSLMSTLMNVSEIDEISKQMTQFSDKLHQATSQFKL